MQAIGSVRLKLLIFGVVAAGIAGSSSTGAVNVTGQARGLKVTTFGLGGACPARAAI
jgi:hypothetical protein